MHRGGEPYSLGVRLTFNGSEFTNAQFVGEEGSDRASMKSFLPHTLHRFEL